MVVGLKFLSFCHVSLFTHILMFIVRVPSYFWTTLNTLHLSAAMPCLIQSTLCQHVPKIHTELVRCHVNSAISRAILLVSVYISNKQIKILAMFVFATAGVRATTCYHSDHYFVKVTCSTRKFAFLIIYYLMTILHTYIYLVMVETVLNRSEHV